MYRKNFRVEIRESYKGFIHKDHSKELDGGYRVVSVGGELIGSLYHEYWGSGIVGLV